MIKSVPVTPGLPYPESITLIGPTEVEGSRVKLQAEKY